MEPNMPMAWLNKVSGGRLDGLLKNLAKDRGFKNGLVSALALTATGDMELEAEEEDGMLEIIMGTEKLKDFDHQELFREFQAKAHQALDRVKRLSLMQEVGKLKDKSDQAMLVVGLCVEMANYDNAMEEGEVKVIKQLCRTLNLDARDFDLTVTG